MAPSLDQIKDAIRMEHKQLGRVDPEKWFGLYPEHRKTLESVFRLIARVDSLPAPREEIYTWVDPGGRVAKARQNMTRILEVRIADPIETALGAALARSRAETSAALEVSPTVAVSAASSPRVFVLALVVDALHRAGARLHQFMGQKLAYLADAGLGFGQFPAFAPADFGMFDKGLYALETAAGRMGWFSVVDKKYSPKPKMSQDLRQLVPEILKDPVLTERYLDYLAVRTNHELEVWGMTRYAALIVGERNGYVTVPMVRAFFISTPAWEYKVAHGYITDEHIQHALEHLVRLQLVPHHLVDLID